MEGGRERQIARGRGKRKRYAFNRSGFSTESNLIYAPAVPHRGRGGGGRE